ncbi:hypothetical protein KC19_6G012000 [Ceratodon purpureus]|uniref:Uncharacterized protein n=1 Tax=Ceratodon purpureus TaxID=3225 RepID=A0A8T0HDV9_CERPU|nr:hypothetical protein KC19_6G012000 [Ceratodon purpureus]
MCTTPRLDMQRSQQTACLTFQLPSSLKLNRLPMLVSTDHYASLFLYLNSYKRHDFPLLLPQTTLFLPSMSATSNPGYASVAYDPRKCKHGNFFLLRLCPPSVQLQTSRFSLSETPYLSFSLILFVANRSPQFTPGPDPHPERSIQTFPKHQQLPNLLPNFNLPRSLTPQQHQHLLSPSLSLSLLQTSNQQPHCSKKPPSNPVIRFNKHPPTVTVSWLLDYVFRSMVIHPAPTNRMT